jgi:hypothetical protein
MSLVLILILALPAFFLASGTWSATVPLAARGLRRDVVALVPVLVYAAWLVELGIAVTIDPEARQYLGLEALLLCLGWGAFNTGLRLWLGRGRRSNRAQHRP